ncbi:MAG: chorismate mutase [Clostridia bacterium]|nr:chorismate mutase [Clostridia bacterium]
MKDYELDKAREEIDACDAAMAELFCRRMEAVKVISEYKKRQGLPVNETDREEALVAQNALRIADDSIRPYYVGFLRDTMKAARLYQSRQMQGMRVAFSGIEGAFASIAAGKIFPSAERIPYNDFSAAYRAVEQGDCDVAVLPIENSTAGEVGQVTDLMFSGGLFVTGIYDFSIHHHLLGTPEATVEGIREVISHPQALAQCEEYIREHSFSQIQAGNTAMAAKQVADRMDPSVAAIASAETAELYGLKVLARNINETDINTTRFAVFARAPLTVGDAAGKHSILLFTVRHEAGFLAQAINVIGEYGYNMRCLRSRPMKSLLWQYYFYVELEGDLTGENGQRMLEALKPYCERLKMLGCFQYPTEL